MSYIIEPMSLTTFLEEPLKLPRFQRKATWDKKQNFELAISIFQDYPVGVVIINREQKVSWLLDGRQRRNAIISMRDNPVELYEWARNYIGFKKTADELEVSKAYWGKVEKYLQTEEKSPNQKSADAENDPNLYSDEEEAEYDETVEDSFDSGKQRHGLQTLLDLILMVHQNKPQPLGSKWEQTFDFRAYFSRLKYAPAKNGNIISPTALRSFILELNKAIEQEYDGKLSRTNFIDYYIQTFDVSNQVEFEKDVAKKWSNITNSIDVIMRTEKIFADARIGIIRLTNAAPLDAQNIFSRINKGGTQLKAEELLSAKPYWNREVSINDLDVIEDVKILYTKLGIPCPDSIVRWDLAATLISQIQDGGLVFDSSKSHKGQAEISMDNISLGFKLLSAIYQGGISGKHVVDMEKNENIKWDRDIDEFVNNLNVIFNIILQDSFFKYLQSWKMPITKLLGNTVALEFTTILWLDWEKKGCPRFSESGEMKALRRDARTLLDRLIFEYATKTWRGSGDSKLSNDLKIWSTRITPVNQADWKNFIAGACDGNYNGQQMTVKLLRPVLYYYYVITSSTPINQANISFDVDHIIPKERFNGNNAIDQSFQDSLVNLALLPTKDNISKKSKMLNEITDSWLKLQITTYTGIEESDFQKYSDMTNLALLRTYRKNLFLVGFDTNRAAVLAN